MIYRIIYSDGQVGCTIHDMDTAKAVAKMMAVCKDKYPIAILKIKLK